MPANAAASGAAADTLNRNRSRGDDRLAKPMPRELWEDSHLFQRVLILLPQLRKNLLEHPHIDQHICGPCLNSFEIRF